MYDQVSGLLSPRAVDQERRNGVSLYHRALGLIERAEGNLSSAMHSLEHAHEIRGDDPPTLVELVRTELELFNPTERNFADDVSGPWMQRLDERVSASYMPGFLGLALLLKAELRRKQGRHEEEEELLGRVKEIAKNPGVLFLRDLLIQLVTANR